MNKPSFLSTWQWVLIRAALPRDRLDEILGDLEDGYGARKARLGPTAARRHLMREVASLILWRVRLWRGAAATREAAGVTSMRSRIVGHDFFQDLRFGARNLRRRPLFAFMAIGVLALGIGAPTTVLTLVNQIFFHRPEHLTEPDRIVRLTRAFAPGQGGGALANPDYLYYREAATTLSGLAAYGGDRAVAYTADGTNHDQLMVQFVSDNYFEVLGVPMASGRGFRPEENGTPGTHPVAVLSFGFWTRAMGGNPDVLGAEITLAGAEHTVIGVAPEGFGAISPVASAPDVWVPIAMYGRITRATDTAWWERLPNNRSRWLQGLGRLAPGVTFEAARANLVALGLALDFEGKPQGEGAFLQRQFLYSPRLEATLGSLSRMLLAVVVMVFLVAAANVAVLLLFRATTRRREMSVRTALGAGRSRIVRQVLAETMVLGLSGGFLGIGLAFGLSDLAASLLPVSFAAEFRPDAGVVGAALGLSILITLGVGLLPALRVSRGGLRAAMGERGADDPRSRLQSALIVAQVGLSLVLVSGAILFGRSFWTARTQDVGFATENRLVLQINLRELDYGAEEGRLFVRDALSRIGGLPAVRSVATTRQIPYQGDWTTEFDAPPGAEPNHGEGLIFTGLNAVSPGYFQVSGIPVVRGRPLNADDVAGSPRVAVINQALADAVWPGQDPVGKVLPIDDERVVGIVGVAGNANYYQLGEDPAPQLYLSEYQFFQPRIHFLVHTSGDAAGLAPQVQSALREIDPRLVFGWVTTMDSVFEDQIARYQVTAILVSVFSAIALLLAAAGLYGTLSFLVAKRRREIGVRMALGADRRRVTREVMVSGLRLAVLGVALGLVGSVFLRTFTGSLLYNVEPTDPLPLVGAGLVLLAVTAAANFPPARSATRVDPMEAMRAE
jgi:predicted permease